MVNVIMKLRQPMCAAVVLALAQASFATQLQLKDIPASPYWVVHLDCDRLKTTQVGKYIFAEMDKPEELEKVSGMQNLFNVDLRNQLHGLTLYSSKDSPEDGVLLVYGDFDAERLTTIAKSARKYESVRCKSHVIHSWINEKKKPKKGVRPRTYAAIQGKRLIFAQHEATVAAALDVIDGSSTTLASEGDYAELGSSKTAVLQGAARKLALKESDPNAALLRFSKSLRLQVSEIDQHLNATLNVEAHSEEVAQSLKLIAQGLISLMKLQTQKPETARFAEALALKQQGSTINVSLKMPVKDVIELIKLNRERKATKAEKSAEQK